MDNKITKLYIEYTVAKKHRLKVQVSVDTDWLNWHHLEYTRRKRYGSILAIVKELTIERYKDMGKHSRMGGIYPMMEPPNYID